MKNLRLLRILSSFVCLGFFAGSLYGQSHTPRTINVNSNCGGFYEYLPVGYAAATGKFPVIIAFHGAGSYGTGSATDLNRVLREQAAFYINRGQFPATFTVNGETTSFIVISPQLRSAATPAHVDGIINYVLANYKADPNRVYLMGYSIGGNHVIKYATSSQAAALKVAAMVPVASYINPYTDAGANFLAAAPTAVWALHSNNDVNAPVRWSQDFVNKVNSFNPGIPAIITRFNNITHNQTDTFVCKPTYRVGGRNIYEWMLQYRRNFPPIARAGANQSITLPANSVSLSGATSSDPENGSLSYAWRKIAGPTPAVIGTPAGSTTSVGGLVAGVYQIELAVTDNTGQVGRDTVQVTVVNPLPNVLPVANAGSDLTIDLPLNTITLDGTQSNDADGSIEQYNWRLVSGPVSFNIANPAAAVTQVTGLKKGTYVFELRVTDNEGGQQTDTRQVIVNNPNPNIAPVANAGPDQTVALPTNTVMLNAGASSDADGELVSYLWEYVSGPAGATITNAQAVQTFVNNLVQGTYVFRLTVQDDSSATGTDLISVQVNPIPTASTRFVRVNLFGGANPQTTGGWNNWNINGSGLSNLTSPALQYDNGAASGITAVLSFTQAISDNGADYGGTMCPPGVLRYTSHATINRTITIRGLNNNATYSLALFASRRATTTNANSTRFAVGTQNVTVGTDNNRTNAALLENLRPTNGQLVVSINKVNTFNYINGFVLTETVPPPPGNQAPVARAGNDQTITLPNNTANLNGSASSDADGTIATFEWNKIAGPESFIITNGLTATPTLSGLVAGVYDFQLRVTDNNGVSGFDTVRIVVSGTLPQPPVARAGNDITVYVPVSTTQLSGIGSFDPDGSIVSYNWRQDFGPTETILTTPTAVSTGVSNLLEGEYSFILTVRDNTGLETEDTLRVHVIIDYFLPPAVADSINCGQAVRIVVLGSSTTFGTGASVIDSSWVAKFRTYLVGKNPANEVINLGQLSKNTYQILCPTGFIPPEGRPLPDPVRNITRALELTPDAIIVNLPSNDAASNFTLEEQQANWNRADSIATAAGVPMWVTTTQPRSSLSPTPRQQLVTMRDWLLQRFGSRAIDFWTGIGNEDGSIIDVYNVDNVHVNDFGHHLFYRRVVAARILDQLCVAGNQLPTVNAGVDQSIRLPVSATTLTGTATDADGTIVSTSWLFLSGPVVPVIVNAGNLGTAVNGLTQAGRYVFVLRATDNFGAERRDTIAVDVLSALNNPPIARAGIDQAITLPTSTVTLNGNASADADGTIVGYLWEYVSGPTSFSIGTPTAAQTTVSGLAEGVYRFRLGVTDDSSAVAFDTLQVTVNAQPTSVTRQILVNLFGGANPQSSGGWNNWNVGGSGLYNLSSGALRYADGNLSTIAALLSFTQAVSDNGAGYGGTGIPTAVWRYTSHATINRSITLSGLNNAARYDISLFAGRTATTTNANSTRFSIGTQSVTVGTDNNKTVAASFSNVAPVNGQLVIGINRVNTFNYINGFTITETAPANTTAPVVSSPLLSYPGAGADELAATTENGWLDGTTIVASPNPVVGSRVSLRLGSAWRGGPVHLRLSNAIGSVLSTEQQVVQAGGQVTSSVDFSQLKPGIYFLQLTGRAGSSVVRLLKQQ
ncbi:MAG: PKD domain-containing protein [Chitinophagaceae bacterium]|nr:PKD domain-containing protein [Chitinophagaceae bacterium]